MRYNYLAAVIWSIYRTGRPAMYNMIGQAYISSGGPLRAFTNPWREGETS